MDAQHSTDKTWSSLPGFGLAWNFSRLPQVSGRHHTKDLPLTTERGGGVSLAAYSRQGGALTTLTTNKLIRVDI